MNSNRASALRFEVLRESIPATYSDVVDAWRRDSAFRSWFNALLAATPFTAFCWETPPVTAASAQRRFEFVMVDSPELVRGPDPAAFTEYFRGAAPPEIMTFPNLGADALLIVPRPIGDQSAYGHIQTFARRAPASQQQALWQAVGDAMARRIDERPVWLSTAGAGVAWLHVRLDDRPKYYRFAPYTSAL